MKSSWMRNVVTACALLLSASVACAASRDTPNDATGGLIGSCCVFFGLVGSQAAEGAFERAHGGPAAPVASPPATSAAPPVADADYRPTGSGPAPIETLDGEWKVVTAGERWRAVTDSRSVEGTVTAVSQRGIAIAPDGGGAAVVVLAKDLRSLVRR